MTTKSDAVGLNGIFLECKLRAKWAIWELYTRTAKLANKEKNIPVVSIFKKGHKGFMDVIHSMYIDEYIRIMSANRRIVIDGHSVSKIVGGYEVPMKLLFSGPIKDCITLSRLIRPSCFDGDGNLVDRWWECRVDDVNELDPFAIVKSGYSYALYGWVSAFKLNKELVITEADMLAYKEVMKEE